MNSSQRQANKNIVITGFMGTGKTTVGREVAGRLDHKFYDTDEIIETRTKMRIADIFDRHGETYFRKIETAVITELARFDQAVIATGGGTLLAMDTAKMVAQTGIIFCLVAELPVLAARLKDDTNRPLLKANNRGAALQALWQQRVKQYQRLPNHIDTTHLSPSETAALIIKRYQQLTSRVAGRP